MEKLIDIELKIVSDRRDGLLLALGEVLNANRFNLRPHPPANNADGVLMVLVVEEPESNLSEKEGSMSGSVACLAKKDGEGLDTLLFRQRKIERQERPQCVLDQKRLKRSIRAMMPCISSTISKPRRVGD